MEALVVTLAQILILTLGSFAVHAFVAPRRMTGFGWSLIARSSLHAALLGALACAVMDARPETPLFGHGDWLRIGSVVVLLGVGYIEGEVAVRIFTDRWHWTADDDT